MTARIINSGPAAYANDSANRRFTPFGPVITVIGNGVIQTGGSRINNYTATNGSAANATANAHYVRTVFRDKTTATSRRRFAHCTTVDWACDNGGGYAKYKENGDNTTARTKARSNPNNSG